MSEWHSGSIVVTHAIGLHARPSVKLTKLAKGFPARIEIAAQESGPWVDAKSIVKVMAMKVPQEATLHVRASGENAAQACNALIQLVRNDFQDGEGG
jgi:phosphocarrier protein